MGVSQGQSYKNPHSHNPKVSFWQAHFTNYEIWKVGLLCWKTKWLVHNLLLGLIKKKQHTLKACKPEVYEIMLLNATDNKSCVWRKFSIQHMTCITPKSQHKRYKLYSGDYMCCYTKCCHNMSKTCCHRKCYKRQMIIISSLMVSFLFSSNIVSA